MSRTDITSPKLTAHVNVKGTKCLCEITSLFKLEQKDEKGFICSLHEGISKMSGKDFTYGFIRPMDGSRDIYFTMVRIW